MSGLYVYDAAYSPDLAKLATMPGAVAVNGYLTGTYANTTTSPAAAHAHGLGFVPTYERARDELVGATESHGVAVGKTILAAFKAKGIPCDGSVAVYPSVDVNVSSGRASSCNRAWRGMRSVLAGKVSLRAYAEGAVIDALVKAGLVDGPCWLAAPTSWPGYDVNDPNVVMVQLVGSNMGGTDRNHLVMDPSELGAWWPAGSKYTQEGDPLADLTKAQLAQIAEAVWAAKLSHKDFSGKTVPAPASTFLTMADIRAALNADKVDAVAQVLGASGSGVAARVASLQKAVDDLRSQIAELAPPAPAEVDVDAVAAKVVEALKSLSFKASE